MNIHPMLINTMKEKGFPGGSDGKESACNVGHLCSIPGLGRSPGDLFFMCIVRILKDLLFYQIASIQHSIISYDTRIY